MKFGVRREEKTLGRIFGKALWLAALTPLGAVPFGCDFEGTGEKHGVGGDAATSHGAGAAGPNVGGSGGGGQMDPCAPVQYQPDPPDNCGVYLNLPCGLPKGVEPRSNCFLSIPDCQTICGSLVFNCHSVDKSCVEGSVVEKEDGSIDLDCSVCASGVGRVPAGLARARLAKASALGVHFAAAAHLEEASVHAFRRLHGELRAHRAPASLLRATKRAERDEVRHTRITKRLAKRFGGRPVKAEVAPLPLRSLEVVAIENAVEGCVRETFGALVASFQAERARDTAVASAMKTIAEDETRHAALSWAIARWSYEKLGAEARGRLGKACREAVESLKTERASPAELMEQAGMPDESERRALLAALEHELWAELA